MILAFAAILMAGVAGIALLMLARFIPKRLVPSALRDGIDKLCDFEAEVLFDIGEGSRGVFYDIMQYGGTDRLRNRRGYLSQHFPGKA